MQNVRAISIAHLAPPAPDFMPRTIHTAAVDDSLAPSRGILVALLLGLGCWTGIVGLVRLVF